MKRTLTIIVAFAVFVVLTKLLVEDVLGWRLDELAMSWLEHAGVGSAAAVVALLAADVLLPVPSSAIMVLSGAAFGVWWGAALALVGSVLGEWLGFEVVRRYGRRAALRFTTPRELDAMQQFFSRHGALAIVVTRAMPVVMETMSLVAGLSAMRRRVFLLASVAGTAPIVVVYAYAGAMSREVGNLLPAAVILIAVGAAGWLYYRARINRRTELPSSVALRDSSRAARTP